MLEEQTKTESATIIQCKFCQSTIDLDEMRKLPKKLIIEKHGLCWTGLEKVYLNIYKVQCQSCKKKYSHKLFSSEYIYK
tara:strand:+ start:662 stop:898 length:237 start_codon:yes stop_codon:yes gene_type:complete